METTMAKPEYPDVEFRPHPTEHLSAWADGKYLGVVHTNGDGVYVRLTGKVLSQAARKMRSGRRFDGGADVSTGADLSPEAVEIFKTMVASVDFPPSISRSIVLGFQETGRLHEALGIVRQLAASVGTLEDSVTPSS